MSTHNCTDLNQKKCLHQHGTSTVYTVGNCKQQQKPRTAELLNE